MQQSGVIPGSDVGCLVHFLLFNVAYCFAHSCIAAVMNFSVVSYPSYSGSKKCPNVCMIWKDQIGVIC
jgi:hypothetical protein